MASNTMATWNKRKWKHAKLGRKRKNQEAHHSTPSAAELFAHCGEPGKAAQAVRAAGQAAQAAKK